jgi:serine/threonine protein kinase
MIAGKRYYGPLVDIWSLGVILFALVCGYLPFEDPNTSQLYRKILSGNYTTPKWISHDINNLISKILETDSTKRYRISDIQKHSWYSISCDNIDNTCNKILSDDDPIIHSMSLNGNDPKEVIDGLVSSACNSLTATYHLLLQKRNRDLIIADNFKTKKAYDKTDYCKDEYSAEKTEKEAATYDAQIDKSRCDNDSVIPTPLMQVDGVPVSDARNASLTDDLHKSPAVIVIKNKDSPLKTVASARAPIASKPSKLSVRMQETHLR